MLSEILQVIHHMHHRSSHWMVTWNFNSKLQLGQKIKPSQWLYRTFPVCSLFVTNLKNGRTKCNASQLAWGNIRLSCFTLNNIRWYAEVCIHLRSPKRWDKLLSCVYYSRTGLALLIVLVNLRDRLSSCDKNRSRQFFLIHTHQSKKVNRNSGHCHTKTAWLTLMRALQHSKLSWEHTFDQTAVCLACETWMTWRQRTNTRPEFPNPVKIILPKPILGMHPIRNGRNSVRFRFLFPFLFC